MIALASLAFAQQYAFPSSASDRQHYYPTAYVDHAGSDHACGSMRYGGHEGSDFGAGSWAGMNAGRDVNAAARRAAAPESAHPEFMAGVRERLLQLAPAIAAAGVQIPAGLDRPAEQLDNEGYALWKRLQRARGEPGQLPWGFLRSDARPRLVLVDVEPWLVAAALGWMFDPEGWATHGHLLRTAGQRGARVVYLDQSTLELWTAAPSARWEDLADEVAAQVGFCQDLLADDDPVASAVANRLTGRSAYWWD